MSSIQEPGRTEFPDVPRRSGLGPQQAGRPRRTAVAQVRAVEFIQRMRGASQPCLLRCDDGAAYIVKFRNNPQHVRILANELFAGRLAHLVGLPVPEPAIVDVPAELIRDNPSLEIEAGPRHEPCAAGRQFGSQFPGVPSQTFVVDFLPDRLLRRVNDLVTVFLGALVFDKWTCNCDGRQTIFYKSVDQEGSSYSAFLIDHGFCFNDGDWNFPDSPIRGLYPRRLVYESVRGLQSFEPFLSKAENLEGAAIEKCVEEIPEEWCGGEPRQLFRLAEQLFERRRRLRQALVDAKNSSLKPFPNWA